MSNIEEIRQRAAKATPGHWFWWGDTESRRVDLSAKLPGYGWRVVMGFRRWGMQGAQPVFRDERDLLVAAETLPIYQVAPDAIDSSDPRVYRQTLIGFRHPDAEFIAHARQDVDDLLAYIDDLESQIVESNELEVA